MQQQSLVIVALIAMNGANAMYATRIGQVGARSNEIERLLRKAFRYIFGKDRANLIPDIMVRVRPHATCAHSGK